MTPDDSFVNSGEARPADSNEPGHTADSTDDCAADPSAEELSAKLEKLFENVEDGGTETVRVKDLLTLYGYQNLGRRIRRHIETSLEKRGIRANPSLEVADRYGEVELRSAKQWSPAQAPTVRLPISSLSDEGPELTSVLPTDKLSKARTLMIKYNFSQIPVIASNKKDLIGTITWESIANGDSENSSEEARHWVVHNGYVARSSDDLIDLVPHIMKDEFIYYRDERGFIVGIATASDVASAFRSATGIFLSLSEIEGRLRSLVYRLDDEDVVHCLPERDRPLYKNVEDLSFGDYESILGNKTNWAKLELGLDRSVCVGSLREVKDVRNRLMHFRQGLSNEEDEPVVEQCLAWLRSVTPNNE